MARSESSYRVYGRDPGARTTFHGDRVRWGPVIAGLFSAITVLVILAILGLAVGLTALETTETDQRTIGTAAAIWGGASALIAFFIGGWVAGRNAATPGDSPGLINGLMVGVTTVVLMLWLVGTGAGNLLGALTSNLQLIAVSYALGNTELQASAADARTATWITLASLLLALGASALGGWFGGRVHEAEVEPVESRVPAEA
jgi:hypothetical protein